ncbi:hypothetical protein, partial [Mesorhizobium sp. M1A.F.Ca.ET.072.01.1.1]|uniref:hypothetical protein n=1 Tax=Mesorhizobium sp. M1A.F.Ca.ET.072.01.1.1 TaxID=2496753 RepID=UPI001AECB54E
MIHQADGILSRREIARKSAAARLHARPRGRCTLASIEKPARPFRISLDGCKRNGINISPSGYFGSFVPEHLFQTEDQAFHYARKTPPEGPWERFPGNIG